MKKSAIDALHIEPRSEDELQDVISRFEAKWQHKVDRFGL